jgi:vacuolar-type H+-ATPase subunit I/STV1
VYVSLTPNAICLYVVHLTFAAIGKNHPMKPTGNIHRLPVTDSWQRQPQIKNALVHRIKNITGEIHSIQAEMHGQLNEPTSENKLARFFEDENAVQSLNDFKAELDQLRRILWFYLEQASVQPSAAMSNEQHDTRLQRVNELLRTLAPATKSVIAGEAIQPSVSFFERLDVVIDTYMQEKKPVAQVKAKAAKAGY